MSECEQCGLSSDDEPTVVKREGGEVLCADCAIKAASPADDPTYWHDHFKRAYGNPPGPAFRELLAWASNCVDSIERGANMMAQGCIQSDEYHAAQKLCELLDRDIHPAHRVLREKAKELTQDARNQDEPGEMCAGCLERENIIQGERGRAERLRECRNGLISSNAKAIHAIKHARKLLLEGEFEHVRAEVMATLGNAEHALQGASDDQ